MKILVLSDNKAAEGFEAEWGLSFWIEEAGQRVLLDTGASPLFAENAVRLGLNLTDIDLAVLSHAHYDHSDGMARFFELNDHAPFYLRAGTEENCYGTHENGVEYIGIARGTLETYRDRIRYAEGDFRLGDNIYLIPHKTGDLPEIGKKSGMFICTDIGLQPETFGHEQSLVFRTEQGLVIFNSCSHSGADNILTEVAATFPEDRLYAIIGGFHLYETSPEDVRALARRLLQSGVQHIITGHCTGDEAFSILKEELGDKLQPTYAGLELTL